MTQDKVLFNIKNPDGVCKIPVGTTLLGYRGSIAHNMYVPNSDPNSIDDIDLMGVVLAPQENYLGLSEWGSRGTKEFKEAQYDCVFYDIKKFVSLLLQGNPNVLGMLWLRNRDYLIRSPAADLLVRSRSYFVGKHVYNAFAGYAYAQLSKMETRDPVELAEYLAITAELKHRGKHPNHKGEMFPDPLAESEAAPGVARDVRCWTDERLIVGLSKYQKKGENIGYLGDKRKRLVLEHGYDSKNAAHCIRLLRMCKEFMQTGELVVFRTDDAAELLDIKRGKWPLSQVKELTEQLFSEIKAAKEVSPLPPEPEREKVECLLVAILRDHLNLLA